MLDARKILEDLQRQAGEFARDDRVQNRLDQAKSAADKLRNRLETDPQARNIAAGAGGLLLLGLLGTKGGRNMIGDVAKLGVTAGLGALAYRAWSQRRGGGTAPEPGPEELRSAGYLVDSQPAPQFAMAIVHAMLGAAWADGVLEARERIAIEAALVRAGADEDDRRILLNDMPEDARIAEIRKGAGSRNEAEQIYAAAAISAGETAGPASKFLARLADALGIDEDVASAIRSGV